MSEPCYLPRPEVTRTTRLNPDQARWQALEEGHYLGTAQAPIECNLPGIGDTVDLKDILGQIKADGGNLHGVAPLSV